eukprot:2627798-Prymnesium_polylepis.1
MPPAGSLQCLFGIHYAAVSVHNATTVTCVAPQNAPAQIPFQLVAYDQVLTQRVPWNSSSQFQDFVYHSAQTVQLLVPSSGPSFGGHDIIVRGDGFILVDNSSAAILCNFDGLLSFATLLNSTALSCQVPRHYSSRVPVEVTFNGQDFTSCGVLYEYKTFTITRLYPMSGRATGGTDVTVELDVEPTMGDLYCRFGHTLPVPAARLGMHAVQCRSPPHTVGMVELHIVSLGHDNFEAVWNFEYTLDPEVHKIHPSRGLEAFRTSVLVTGANFVNSSALSCAFGNLQANATFISNTTLVCVSPVYTGAVFESMSVPLRVSTNVSPHILRARAKPLDSSFRRWCCHVHGARRIHLRRVACGAQALEYSLRATTFDYMACPNGAVCSSGQIVSCPPGAYCDGRGGTNLTLCPPGTFQSRAGLGQCDACPIGYYCPEKGLTAPLVCAFGMVCSLSGLAFPNSICPPGHYCPLGVRTLEPKSESTLERPIECPENTWCTAGASSNVSILGNFSTPQPCITGFVCYRGSDSPQGSGPCPS